MQGRVLIRLLGVSAMLITTMSPREHCAVRDASGADVCCASIPAEPGQDAPSSVPDSSRDCAGHHLAPCCDGMPALPADPVTSGVTDAVRMPEPASRQPRPGLRSGASFRPPIAIS